MKLEQMKSVNISKKATEAHALRHNSRDSTVGQVLLNRNGLLRARWVQPSYWTRLIVQRLTTCQDVLTRR